VKILTICIVALTLTGGLAYAAESIVAPNKQAPQAIASETKSELLDINTATEAELKALPGLKEKYVKKIIASRPFTDISQLKTKARISPYAYRKIEGLVTVKQPK